MIGKEGNHVQLEGVAQVVYRQISLSKWSSEALHGVLGSWENGSEIDKEPGAGW